MHPQSGAENWQFAVASFVFGPGLIVNGVLKSWVGRARPIHITDFGGDRLFSPMLEITGQCDHNCSFSSGEVALTSTVAFVALALIWPRLHGKWRAIAVFSCVGLISLSMFLRISLGRHFMSDALTSVAISALVTLAAYRLCRVGPGRTKLTPSALKADFRGLFLPGQPVGRPLPGIGAAAAHKRHPARNLAP